MFPDPSPPKKLRLKLLLLGTFFLALFLAAPWIAPISSQTVDKVLRVLHIRPEPTPETTPPPLPPLPEKFFPITEDDVIHLFNGIVLKSNIETTQGELASRERTQDSAYQVDLQLNIQIPKASQTKEELLSVNPDLETVLSGLPSLLASAKVSPFYHSLYQRKMRFTSANIRQFQRLLTRHNLFDCETVLELTSPVSGRKALLIQSEMDVVTDGTDSDRTLEYDASSRNFQPFTSYSWAKKTKTPNPFIRQHQDEIKHLGQQLESGTLSADQRQEVSRRIRFLQKEIPALKYRSSLVATLDPFIVIPRFFLKYKDNAFAPHIGDYALVIHGKHAYPAIVGDAGPNTKIGEASLLICQAINQDSSGIHRAVDDLTVTYLVFPGTVTYPWGPPDFHQFETVCQKLLEDLGGTGVSLFDWGKYLEEHTQQTTAVESPSPPQAQEPDGETVYIVEPGDSLWTIARRQGTTIQALKDANTLTSDVIRTGQILKIPAAPPSQEPPTGN